MDMQDLEDLKAFADLWLTDSKRSEDYYYHFDGRGGITALDDMV